MDYPFNPTTKEDWQQQPAIRNAFNTLVPLVGSGPWSAALGPAHLPWSFQKNQPKDMPRITKPDVWICYRSNPAISSLDITSLLFSTKNRLTVNSGALAPSQSPGKGRSCNSLTFFSIKALRSPSSTDLPNQKNRR